jgi:hypothetical protein
MTALPTGGRGVGGVRFAGHTEIAFAGLEE